MIRVTINIYLILWGLFQSTTLQGQSSSLDKNRLQENFAEKVTNLHQEKVYIHTDRSIYLTGETLWMSAYCLDAALHVPVDASKVLNIELINSNGDSIKKERIQLSSGLGRGQMFVSPDIKTGTYILRAFTNWMKNFDSEFVFKKRITIVNPSVVPEVAAPLANIKPNVEFFPEGGDLVENLKSKVAIKATKSNGEGVSLVGVVFDNEDNEITKFTTSKMGFASFELEPESGKTYTAKIVADSLILNYDLPQVLKSGAVLSVSPTQSGDYSVEVNATEGKFNRLYMIVHTRGIIGSIIEIGPNGSSKSLITAESLKSGLTHISILDFQFNPLAERLIFKYPKDENIVELETAEKTYGKRESISIKLKNIVSSSTEDIANLSLSVFKKGGQSNGENIVSNLLLTSDIKGEIRNPWLYFDSSNDKREEQMDLLLLTQGWRRFNWEDIKEPGSTDFDYLIEKNSPILSGQVLNSELLPSIMFMSFTGRASVVNSVSIEEDGRFSFQVPFRVQDDNVGFYLSSDTLENQDIKLDAPFDLKNSKYSFSNHNFSEYSMNYLEGLYENIQFSQVYRDYNHINGNESKRHEISTHFYGQPDVRYKLDDYTRFGTVKDFFIEYIRSAVIRKKNNQDYFYIVQRGVKNIPAFVLIDGVPILNSETVLNFDPSVLEEIAIVSDTYYLGSSQYSGIISFTTYDGNFGGQELPQYLIQKAYKGIQTTRDFYSPNYSQNGDQLKRIPDYRNTLYWNPNVKLTGEDNIDVSFFSADETGTYQIEINGITNSGKPIHQTHSFNVTSSLP